MPSVLSASPARFAANEVAGVWSGGFGRWSLNDERSVSLVYPVRTSVAFALDYSVLSSDSASVCESGGSTAG